MLRKSDSSFSRVTSTLTDCSSAHSIISSLPMRSEAGKSGVLGMVLWLFPPGAVRISGRVIESALVPGEGWEGWGCSPACGGCRPGQHCPAEPELLCNPSKCQLCSFSGLSPGSSMPRAWGCLQDCSLGSWQGAWALLHPGSLGLGSVPASYQGLRVCSQLFVGAELAWGRCVWGRIAGKHPGSPKTAGEC